MKKAISIILLAIILLQSCVIYKKTPVSISESTNKGKVKIVRTNGEKVALKSMEYDFLNGTYWGLRKGYSMDHRYKIDPTQVAEVYIIDKHDSRTGTVIVVIAIVIAIPLTFWILLMAGY
jgi:hypothetical protein